MSAIEISIVMPCLNEAETIAACIIEAKEGIASCGVSGEVIVADNGSIDNSRDIAKSAGAKVVNIPDKGYGSALIGGIKAARGIYVMIGDADGSYMFSQISDFLEPLRGGARLVMGCRLPKGGGTVESGAMPWLHRWIGNPVLSGLGKLFFNAPVDDFHCGLRAFHRQSILDLDLHCTGMEFASEMVVKSVLSGLEITQVPTTLQPDRRSRNPHLRSWRDGWRHLRFMLLFSHKWLFFIPGLLSLIIGAAGFITLMQGPVTIITTTFDTNTLLVFAAFILVGFQALFFAVFIKAYAVKMGILPPDKRITKILKTQLFELGIIGGVVLTILGVGYMIIATLAWSDVGFSDLSYSESLRVVIPGITMITLGVQVIFSGFAMAILSLPYKQDS